MLQAAGVSTNLQTIQYIPYQQKLRLSFAEIGTPAYQIEPTEIIVNELFALVGIKELGSIKKHIVDISPNPCHTNTGINFIAPFNGFFSCKIFDLTGKQVFFHKDELINSQPVFLGWETNEIKSGIYFCVFRFKDENNLSIHTETQKIIVSN